MVATSDLAQGCGGPPAASRSGKPGGRCWYGGCLPRLRVAIATACCAAIAPSSALAQEEDATVDRDSPAAKEYVIPLEGARRDAAPATRDGDRRSAPSGRSARSAVPFGAGITPPVGATSGSGGGDSEIRGSGGEGGQSDGGRSGSSDRSSQSSSDRSSDREATSDLSPPPGAQRPAVLAKGDGGVDESALVLVIAGCVVVAGGLLGLLARRRRAS